MKQHESRLQDVLKEFCEQKHLKDKLLDKKLEELWKQLYKNMAAYTTKLQLRKKNLTVWVSSAPLRQELMYNKVKIIQQINKALEEELIDQIEFR